MQINTSTRVLLIGATGGIGAALADALADTRLTALSRSQAGLDLTDESTVGAAAKAHPGPWDVIFDATGALVIDGQGPEKTIQAIDPAAMAAQFALNAIGPALLLKHFALTLAQGGPTIFASLSARVGSITDNGLGGWVSYRAAKAAQNQIIRTAAIELTRRNPDSICVALHPGTVQTPLTARYLGRHASVTPQEAAQNLTRVVQTLIPAQTGGFFDYAGRPIPW